MLTSIIASRVDAVTVVDTTAVVLPLPAVPAAPRDDVEFSLIGPGLSSIAF